MNKIFSFLMLLMLPVSPSAVELPEILLKSIGGQKALSAVHDIQSITSVGTLTLNGEKGDFLQIFSPPDKYYLEVAFPSFNLVQGHDGETAWQINLNGQVSRLEGFAKQDLLESIYVESFGFLFSDSIQSEAAYLGIKDINDKSYFEVAFFPFTTDTVFAHFDTTTGMKTYTSARVDQLEVVTYVGDYRDVSGLLIPFYSRAEMAQAKLTSEIHLDTVLIDAPIPAGAFSPPEKRNPDYLFPSGADRARLPIRYSNGHIRLEVVINGQKRVWMILDSGASTNFLNRRIMGDFFLDVVGSLPAMGIGGFEEVSLVRTDSIQVGGLTLYGQVAGLIDLDNLSRPIDSGNFGGILGYDFLSRFPVEINYAKSILTVYNADTFQPDSGGFEIPFRLTMQVPVISGEINGIAGDFVVDLGNSFGLVLHRHFVTQNDLEKKLDDVRDLSGLVGGIGEVVAGKSALADGFRMGDILLESIRVMLAESAPGMAGSEQLAGNIGNLVLENFRVLLDYKNSRLILYR